MTDREVKLVCSALLHDVGKVIYRQGDDKRKHSRSGYDFLKDEVGLKDSEVLDGVLYHHADLLRGATSALAKDSLAYIVYIADNIASAADRRESASQDVGFEVSMPLQSVFNILNGNHQNMTYAPKTLNQEDGINYPEAQRVPFDEHFYTQVKARLSDNLRGLEWSQEYINSLLETMEALLSYVPSSTARGELADVSLYDHVRLTAAAASCIYAYLQAHDITDYEEALFKKASAFYESKTFLLYSMDVSGIQDFIYTITSEGALRALRARSFYLEIMMEHIIDCFLERAHLSRANLIYSGGGHCYLLLPNTEQIRQLSDDYIGQVNEWFLQNFKTALYVAGGYAECSTDDLKNIPTGSYAELFRTIGTQISAKKSNRYTAAQIRYLNRREQEPHTRECKVCRRVDHLNEDGKCSVCDAIENFSKNILYDRFFTVTLEQTEHALPLPLGYYLIADNEQSLKKRMDEDAHFVRAYSKNELYTGRSLSTKLWVGDYTTGSTFEEFAREAQGIDRVGILRADVDNMGTAFVSGFDDPQNHNRYVTLSRTATLSRQLSLFFKRHINGILGSPQARKVTIVYSGGDDLFLVGAWDEIIRVALDIRNAFTRYTQGTMTLSAGIGLYDDGYPISASARETERLEDASKNLPGKNAVTLFDTTYSWNEFEQRTRTRIYKPTKKFDTTYSWNEFEQQVLGDKLKVLRDFLDTSADHGKSFLYHLLELIRGRSEKINFARYVYLLSRLEPGKDAPPEARDSYRLFSKRMYEWIKNEQDCKQLQTAMNLYAYLTRQEGEE